MPPKKRIVKSDEVDESILSVSTDKISSTYIKMDPKEHILKLPDTYIGSVEKSEIELWIFDKNERKMVKKMVTIVPGFFKIFDEILVNAYDQYARLKEITDAKQVKEIHVNITPEYISIMNDGEGIDVEIHPEHQIYVPELIFGNLLTSANYEKKNKTTGGKNGIGSKCVAGSVPLITFDGKVKLAKDITLEDKLIGDDGNPRNILSIFHGTGQLYEVSQKAGESYIVNDQHTLTLHMPDHKVIFWNNAKNGWSVVYWDHQNRKISQKSIVATAPQINCPECKQTLSGNLQRHYRRVHKDKEIPVYERKSPIKVAPDTPEVRKARQEIEEFCATIDDNNIIDMEIKDFMALNETTKLRLAGIRGECVQWPKKDVDIDPYVLGLWLGDGDSTGYGYAGFEDNDPEIFEYLNNWSENNGMVLSKKDDYHYSFSCPDGKFKKGEHIFRNQLKKYNLVKNKHVPNDYIVNDRETRLKLLAGFIDTDGNVERDGTRISITQGLNHEELVNNIVLLSRSLGLHTCLTKRKTSWTHNGEKKTGEAFNINITGDIGEIPTLLPRKKCVTDYIHSPRSAGYLTIKDAGVGDYVGITIDGNQRFIINDFTVTHNCANIFSKKFVIETVDGSRKRYFHQEFTNNMSNKTEPVIEKYTKKPFTKITFYPDYARFGMDGLDADSEALLIRRVYDLTATTDKNVAIFLNDERIECKGFEKYVDMYIGAKSDTKRVYETIDENDRWEIVVCDSPDDKFEQVSFVNGIYTFKGGKHVEAIATTISTKLAKHVESRGKKKISLKPSVIRDNMFIFLRSIIEDPSFDSQTKEYLTTVPAKFGSKFTISDKLIEKIAKLDIVDKAIRLSEFKDSKVLSKTDGKKINTLRGIPKLDDANWAGGLQSSQCTLILTEGDSAKAFAIAGLSVIGRDRYGVFPLRGKVLNVREASDDKVSENAEVKNLKIILGLQQGKVYEDLSELRYGSIMILTDADVDGSHIKGLILNLFHHFWPSLLKHPGFIKSMLTPIVKARHKQDIRVFYTLSDYENWKSSGDTSHYEIKYYKGLGTSSSQEAKEYFRDLDNSEIRYLWNEDKAVDETVNLAFNKDLADDRKVWLGNYDRNSIIEHDQRDIPISDFINKDLIHFSKYDCERSVPCLVDGFKPSQRKVIYGTILKNAKKSTKVAQLSAYVAEKSAYHHGEQSLNDTIINLAQDFVGANNMNFLDPEGQFGSRLCGGKDHASPRYIFTRMSDFMPLVFHNSDNALLKYLDDDGQQIEPEFYVPVIPNILVNGCEGIGTGFSTQIPSYNPIDIIANLRRKMTGEEMQPMVPWFRGFIGRVELVDKKGEKKYVTKGLYRLLNEGKVEIYELPIGIWTDKYKEHLENLMGADKDGKKKKKQMLLKYESQYTESRVRFILHFDKAILSEMLAKGTFESELKLIDSGSCSISNMHLFNEKGQIKKYNSPEHIIEEFYEIRRTFYVRRKDYLEEKLMRELTVISARVRFIMEILDEKIILKGKDEEQLDAELEKKGYPKFTKGKLEFDPNETNENPSYDYLTSMPIRNMTKKRVEELMKQREDRQMQFDALKSQSIYDLWNSDLNEIEQTYIKHLQEFDARMGTTDDVKATSSKKTISGRASSAPAKKKVVRLA